MGQSRQNSTTSPALLSLFPQSLEVCLPLPIHPGVWESAINPHRGPGLIQVVKRMLVHFKVKHISLHHFCMSFV